MVKGKKFVVLLAALEIALLASPSFAVLDYTPINPPPYGEPTHATILGSIYSQNFTANGPHYEGDSGVTALRVYDSDSELTKLDIFTGDEGDVDQIWTDGITTVTATAMWATDDQSFGWNQGGIQGTNYQQVLTHNDVGQPGEVIEIDGDFLWGCQPDAQQWWSLNSENFCAEDHFVTYKIEGLGADQTVWMIFMEDRPFSSSDRDYNDFVVEIRAVPEPSSAILLGLGALALLRKRRT